MSHTGKLVCHSTLKKQGGGGEDNSVSIMATKCILYPYVSTFLLVCTCVIYTYAYSVDRSCLGHFLSNLMLFHKHGSRKRLLDEIL